jgi:hypothetical protein
MVALAGVRRSKITLDEFYSDSAEENSATTDEKQGIVHCSRRASDPIEYRTSLLNHHLCIQLILCHIYSQLRPTIALALYGLSTPNMASIFDKLPPGWGYLDSNPDARHLS